MNASPLFQIVHQFLVNEGSFTNVQLVGKCLQFQPIPVPGQQADTVNLSIESGSVIVETKAYGFQRNTARPGAASGTITRVSTKLVLSPIVKKYVQGELNGFNLQIKSGGDTCTPFIISDLKFFVWQQEHEIQNQFQAGTIPPPLPTSSSNPWGVQTNPSPSHSSPSPWVPTTNGSDPHQALTLDPRHFQNPTALNPHSLQTLSPGGTPGHQFHSPGFNIHNAPTMAPNNHVGGIAGGVPLTIIPRSNFGSEWRIVGEGGFGTVYATKWAGTPVAVKTLKGTMTDANRDAFLREVSLMQNLVHPHVVQLLGVITDPGLSVVTELLSCSLADYLAPKNYFSIGWVNGLRVLKEIAMGMAFLTLKQIIHGDLKPQNILLTDSFKCKITDFGESKVKSNSKMMTKALGRTYCYAAPEVIRTGEMGLSSDVFSMGVMFWEVTTGASLYPELARASDYEVTVTLGRGAGPKIPPQMPENVTKTVKACTSLDGAQRPTFEKIIEIVEFLEKECSVYPSWGSMMNFIG